MQLHMVEYSLNFIFLLNKVQIFDLQRKKLQEILRREKVKV